MMSDMEEWDMDGKIKTGVIRRRKEGRSAENIVNNIREAEIKALPT